MAWLALAAAAGSAGAATVEGQLFDRAGQPLAGMSVSLVERSGGGVFSREAPADTIVARATTDRHGFFSFDTGARAVRGRVLVRCHDAARWDAVRYAPPVDRDVTRLLRDRGHAALACVAEDAAAWGAVTREIERAGGPASDRGRVLRRHGLPPETVGRADGSVEWRYPAASFVFRDGSLVTGGEAPGGAPLPAAGATENAKGDAR